MGSSSPDAFGRQANEVRAIFGDLEIVEATADFVVYVTADEQMNATRGDPNNCMFSQACKRALGSKGVLFYPTVAYVDIVDPRDSGRRIVMRFKLPPATRQALEDFDAEIGGFREASFILKAVPRNQTLSAQAKRKRKETRARRVREGKTPTVGKSEAAKKGHETRRSKALLGHRSGSGQIHTRPRTGSDYIAPTTG